MNLEKINTLKASLTDELETTLSTADVTELLESAVWALKARNWVDRFSKSEGIYLDELDANNATMRTESFQVPLQDLLGEFPGES